MALTNTNLGRIGFVLKGVYDAGNEYKELDVVTFAGSVYGALSHIAAGESPDSSGKWVMLLDNTGKLNSNMGAVNSGKILSVDEDGSIVLIDMPQSYAVFS